MPPAPAAKIETTDALMPSWNADGLITAVCAHAETGAPLMVAHMNAEALNATLATKRATFWSRSRQTLWVKGETSGHWLDVVEILIDCDQDCVWLRCLPQGPACHTGESSCFYRRLEDGALKTTGR